MKYFVPFRYKLTFIVAVIIVALLMAIFFVVQHDIELKFRELIEVRLLQAKDNVSQRMNDRYDLLYNDATAVVKDKLVVDVIIDKTLSPLTRNDIVSNEVLPRFNHLSLLAVTNADGKLLAKQQRNASVIDDFLNSDWFGYALEGESVAGYVLHQQTFYQGIAMPAFVGQEMIGIVIAGRELTLKDINKIKQISEIDITVLNGRKAIIATELSGVSEQSVLRDALALWLEEASIEAFQPDTTVEVKLGSERFLLRLAKDETMFVPPYIIARSLDESLSFVTTIRDSMKLLGSIGVFIAIVVGFLFAVGVSTPIRRLTAATSEVAKENFAHRVVIQSKDEFARLGEAFNRMIIDLGEKQKIRRAFDQSVSKEVADHMLSQGTKLGGSTEYATILFADIRGFTSLSEELDENSLINLLNQYFSQVNRCISGQQGVIDKFIGDAVMALFGTPIACEHCALRGLMAARHMLQTVAKFNEQIRLVYGCELNIGIGLNSGKVVAGMVGSDDRLNFTVLGDQVNIASRIESLSKQYGVSLILSESTLMDVKAAEHLWTEPLFFRRLDHVQVKGKSQGFDIYEPFFDEQRQQQPFVLTYETALCDVLNGRLAQALEQLTALAQIWPQDIPTKNLLKDCRKYLSDPQRYNKEYRNGVRILTSK